MEKLNPSIAEIYRIKPELIVVLGRRESVYSVAVNTRDFMCTSEGIAREVNCFPLFASPPITMRLNGCSPAVYG